jgi:hypothetical protein
VIFAVGGAATSVAIALPFKLYKSQLNPHP